MKPKLIHFDSFDAKQSGKLVVSEKENLPFMPKRIYWVTGIEEKTIRGEHAHKKLNQILICDEGKIEIELISKERQTFKYTLSSSDIGLFVPKMYWRKIYYEEGSILLVLAEDLFKKSDYLSNFYDFVKYKIYKVCHFNKKKFDFV